MPSLKVSKIEHGTVIDHIPAGNGRRILQMLQVDNGADNVVSLLMNVESDSLGRKDIVKLEGTTLTPDERTSVAVLAPNATLNVVEHFDIVEKETLDVPGTVNGVLDCPNPECVTNTDEPVDARLTVANREPLAFTCEYCESTFTRGDLHPVNF